MILCEVSSQQNVFERHPGFKMAQIRGLPPRSVNSKITSRAAFPFPVETLVKRKFVGISQQLLELRYTTSTPTPPVRVSPAPNAVVSVVFDMHVSAYRVSPTPPATFVDCHLLVAIGPRLLRCLTLTSVACAARLCLPSLACSACLHMLSVASSTAFTC